MPCCGKQKKEVRREVLLNNRAGNKQRKFCNNEIITSKYTVLTFVPINLMEQFQRIANVYFLLIAILQQIPGVSPLGSYTTAMTLIVVLVFTAVKEAWEDLKRHKTDRATNARPFKVLRDGAEHTVKAKEIEVGDICLVTDNQFFPADLVLLSSSELEGMCYIETKNLDGETNLKERVAPHECSVWGNDVRALTSAQGTLNSEGPNNRIATFDGQLKLANAHDDVRLEPKNILLTGCQLKYCAWIYGLVVFTGDDTKLQQQTKSQPKVIKRSDVERKTNILIIIIFALEVLLCIVSAVGNSFWLRLHRTDEYLGLGSVNVDSAAALSFLTFIILYSNLIPISLYVTMETVKLGQAGLINSDNKMKYTKHAKCNTSSLNEELGQVEYIFSDKTGTLTCNNLVFLCCSIAGRAYGIGTADYPALTPGWEDSGLGAASQPNFPPSATANGSVARQAPPAPLGAPTRGGEVARGRSDNIPMRDAVPDRPAKGSRGAGGDEYTYSYSEYSDGWYSYSYSEQQEEDDDLPRSTAPARGSAMPRGAPGDFFATPWGTNMALPHVGFEDENGRLKADLANKEYQQQVTDFMMNMALNHCVIPRKEEKEPGGISYQAGSPDEGALVFSATYFGFMFHTRTPSTYTVTVLGQERTYEMLSFNFFDNTRKMMSVVVRTPEGKLMLYLKGADSSVLAQIDTSKKVNRERLAATKSHLQRFADRGLRTLCYAQKEITQQEYSDYRKAYDAANKMPSGIGGSKEEKDKRSAVDAAYRMLEQRQDLDLVAASAIEDRLQDGVPDTIDLLRRAGIKIWVLTGDKQDTAIQIAFSCNLFNKSIPIIVLNDVEPEADKEKYKVPKEASDEQKESARLQAMMRARKRMRAVLQEELQKMETAKREGRTEFQCAMDGLTFAAVLGDAGEKKKKTKSGEMGEIQRDIAETTKLLLDLMTQCKAVIGCRVSPAQKAQVVAFVKDNLKQKPITLSIGDGANDVAMIMEAHIGVGISGEEGQQAANAADYAFGQFRFLQQLLLVHGHWCYHRIAKLIYYSFYKNMVLALVPFYFVFYNGFSGQTFVEKWTFSVYNVVFTSLPIIAVGLLDQNVRREFLMFFPALYISGIKRRFFRVRNFLGWALSALYHSLVCFFMVEYMLAHSLIRSDGATSDLFTVGIYIMSCVVLVVSCKLGLETNSWTWATALALFCSVGGFFVWVIAYSYVAPGLSDAWDMYDVGAQVYKAWMYWLCIFFISVMAMVPDVVYKYVNRTAFPEEYDIVKEMSKGFHPGDYRPPPGRVAEVEAWNRSHHHVETSAFAFDQAPVGFQWLVRNAPPTGRQAEKQRGYDPRFK